MTKKSNGWNLAEMQETLVKDAEDKISHGFEEITKGAKGTETAAPTEDTQGTVPAVSAAASVPATTTVIRTARMFHKERTQDILVHCPESLHHRLRERKDHLWDEYGERVTINNMVIEAIALWLDQQENGKVNTTT